MELGKTKLPLDDKNGLVVTVSVKRAGTEYNISKYLEDKSIKSIGELIGITSEAVKLLWDSKDVKSL